MDILNTYLKLRYKYFKWAAKRKIFSSKILWKTDFKSWEGLSFNEGFYNDNDVWFSKEIPTLTANGLEIACNYKPQVYSDWRIKDKKVNYISGQVVSSFMMSYGTWEIEASLCDSWPAIWLLRKDYWSEKAQKNIIIPEVDIMEVIKGYFKPTIHYGIPADDGYRKSQMTSRICKVDEKLHKFACTLLKDGYNIYIDGILIAKFRSKDPEFVSDEPCYLLLNNATYGNTGDTNMVIKSVKCYE